MFSIEQLYEPDGTPSPRTIRTTRGRTWRKLTTVKRHAVAMTVAKQATVDGGLIVRVRPICR